MIRISTLVGIAVPRMQGVQYVSVHGFPTRVVYSAVSATKWLTLEVSFSRLARKAEVGQTLDGSTLPLNLLYY